VTEDVTHDAFLGGRIHLWQPRRGYRAGVDPVLLAASVPARPGQSVLELGCGVGTAMLCLQTRVPGLMLTGVELMPQYADLARRNCAGTATIHTCDLRDLPHDLRQAQFDQVLMNPPYFDRKKGDSATDAGRDLGRAGGTDLADWLDVGIRRLAPKGHLTLIQHISRMPDVLAALAERIGSVVVKPIQPRLGQAPGLFILQARHSGRAPFVMATPLIMHEGTAHLADAESYTIRAREILRQGAALPLED